MHCNAIGDHLIVLRIKWGELYDHNRKMHSALMSVSGLKKIERNDNGLMPPTGSEVSRKKITNGMPVNLMAGIDAPSMSSTINLSAFGPATFRGTGAFCKEAFFSRQRRCMAVA